MTFRSSHRSSGKLGNPGDNENQGKSSYIRELQILPIKIKKDKRKSEFDKV